MSSRSTQIIGGEERQHAFVEGSPLNALRTTDADGIEYGAESGLAFIATHTNLDVASSADVEVLIQVGTSNIGMVLTGSIAGQAHFFLFEGPTVTVAGTSVSVVCRDRVSPKTSTIVVTHTPTTTADGTELLDTFLPGGLRSTATGSLTTGPQSWHLKANTDYLLRMTNLSATTSAITIGLDFVDPGAS